MIADKSTELAAVYTDFNGIAKLKAEAGRQTDEAKRETARQFEALFLQMMIKSMREAGGKGMLDSDQTEMAQGMYDQQLAISLAKKGSIGIADMVMRQLGVEPEKTTQPKSDGRLAMVERLWSGTPAQQSTSPSPLPRWETPEAFVRALYPAAEQAARKLGTTPEAVLSITALETGWGRHVMPAANGSSFNLFGIKADTSWKAGVATARTLEYEDGVMQQKREPFRTYASAEESVADFADFIRTNPRYRKALDVAADPEAFLEQIHRAGYATDPDYAAKARAVLKKVEQITRREA